MSASAAMWEALHEGGPVLLTGPVSPDGDSLGACLALRRILVGRGVDCDVAAVPTYRYTWLPGADHLIADADLCRSYRAVVVLDGDRHRLTSEAEAAFHDADVQGIIDHHASTRDDGYTHAWIDADAGSACEMLYEALPSWGVAIDADLAALLYTGVVFDTGGFRHSNTTPATHQLAAELLTHGIDHPSICARVLSERRPEGLALAGHVFRNARFRLEGRLCVGVVTVDLLDRLHADPGDLEGIVDALVHTVGTEVGALVVERRDGTIKYSLRSRGAVDVARIAQTLTPTGGGHAKASGACIRATPEVAVERITNVLRDAL